MLRFGLIGCGHIGRRHADLLSNGKVDGAILSAVCDVVPERARAFGENFGVPWCTDLQDLLARDDVDVACVLTPSGLHHDHCLACAAAGKHVLVEKPMALRLDHADAMIRACEAAGVSLFVVKQCRFHLPVLKARAAFEAGRFGKLVMASARILWRRDQAYYDRDEWRGTWALDGGVLINQAIHHIDLLQWFMGPAKTVHAVGRNALLDIEAEDTAVATVQFESGALGVIEATNATRPKGVEGSISIFGEGGTVMIGGMAADRLDYWAFGDAQEGDDDALRDLSNPSGVEGYGHQIYYEHVVRSFGGEPGVVVDGREGRRSLELVAALYASLECGEPVRVGTGRSHSRLGRG